MAKAKKSEKSAEKAESKPATKKTAPAANKKSSAPASGQGAPMVDTNLAAQAAARMLAAGAHTKQPQQPAQGQPKQESSLFKQMKAGLNKPASSAMGGLLDKSSGPLQKKPN